MKLIYTGKTKNVYALEDGNYLLSLKDDATGKDGVFDPGENTVGLTIEGLGRESLKLSQFFFNKIIDAGFPCHFIEADLSNVTMKVKPCKVFGKGLEVICRYKAVGSFLKRYGDFVSEAESLDGVVEFTLKDDKRNDPAINMDTLIALNILNGDEFVEIKFLTKQICNLMKEVLAKSGLELYDIKLEFGKFNGQIVLIDEISAGNMRVYKDGKIIPPMELSKYLFD